MSDVEWRPVLGGLYAISRDGQVKRLAGGKGARLGKLLRVFIASTGYPVVNVCIDGRPAVKHVHNLLAEAFLGPRPIGRVVNHIDGVKAHSVLANLEYVTRSENAWHASRMGLLKRKVAAE